MDATLVTAWTALCQLLASAFTAPTSVTFLHVATGWVLCRSKPTVTSLVSTRTVVRQAPLTLIVQTLVKAWYLKHGRKARAAQPHGTDWMPDKDHPSYLDMLATLRKVLWTHRINTNSTPRGRVRQLLETLQFTLCAAA